MAICRRTLTSAGSGKKCSFFLISRDDFLERIPFRGIEFHRKEEDHTICIEMGRKKTKAFLKGIRKIKFKEYDALFDKGETEIVYLETDGFPYNKGQDISNDTSWIVIGSRSQLGSTIWKKFHEDWIAKGGQNILDTYGENIGITDPSLIWETTQGKM